MPREGHDLVSNSASIFRRSISIHVPREGHDKNLKRRYVEVFDFNPRAPRGARLIEQYCHNYANYFNPRAPRGARQHIHLAKCYTRSISIHVPREGHDQQCQQLRGAPNISIHVPREGHDTFPDLDVATSGEFQSTCPARGTTWVEPTRTPEEIIFQSTCPARGTTTAYRDSGAPSVISIHVPREGHDFQFLRNIAVFAISIHVPREGHDVAR